MEENKNHSPELRTGLYEMTAEERHCYEMLATLRRIYEIASKPYIDQLVAIKQARLSPSVVVPVEQADTILKSARPVNDTGQG